MLPSLLSLLLTMNPSSVWSSPESPCEDRQHFDLTHSDDSPREICISSGIMTGFIFDTPAVVELQDEARFLAVSRSQQGFSFVPPRDLAPGERLRLTAELRIGELRQMVTFALVAQPSRATHQVNVYRDRRDWQSIHDEAMQARAQSKRLQEENIHMQAGLNQAETRLDLYSGLRGAYLNGLLVPSGIRLIGARGWTIEVPMRGLQVDQVRYCRSHEGIAVELFLTNLGNDPWTITHAYLLNAQGESRKSVRVWQQAPIGPGPSSNEVFVEFDAKPHEFQGFNTLTLHGTGTASATLTQVDFP